MRTPLALLAIVAAFGTLPSERVRAQQQQPPSAPDPRFEALATLAEAKMAEYRVPGVAIGIVDNGVVTIRGLGVTSVEDPLPVTAHTVFPIASISKTFAATAMMRLVEQGKVDLRAPVRNYLPDFRVQDEAVEPHGDDLEPVDAHERLGRPGVRSRSRRRHAAQLRRDDDGRSDAGGAARRRRGATTTPGSASRAASSKP